MAVKSVRFPVPITDDMRRAAMTAAAGWLPDMPAIAHREMVDEIIAAAVGARPRTPAHATYPGLTKRQAQHFEKLWELTEREGGTLPSIREAGIFTGVSNSTSHWLLKQLVSRGYARTNRGALVWLKALEA